MNNNIDVNVIVNGAEELKNLSVSLRRMILSVQDSAKATAVLDARQRALNTALGNTGRGLNDHAKSLRQAAVNQSVLGAEIKKTTQELKNLNRIAASGRGGAGMGALARDLELTSKNLKKVKARTLVTDLRGVGQEMKRMGKDAQFVGRSLIIGLTTPIVAFGRMGVQNVYAVDKAFVRLEKLLGRTRDKFSELSDAVNDFSYEFGIARELLLGIAGDFAELGINSDKNIASLTRLTSEFTILGDMDVTSARELTQTLYLGSMRAMEMTGEVRKFNSAAEIQEAAIKRVTAQMYLFNAVENATALSMREIAEALPEVSAAGQIFGLQFTEMMALLAPMKAIGIDTGAAATGIKVSFQKLVNPTEKLKKELKALSAEQKALGNTSLAQDFLDIQGIGMDAVQSLVNVTAALKASAGGDEAVLSFYSKLFDDRQATRMLVAMEDLANFQAGFFASAAGGAATAQERFIAAINESLAGTSLYVKDVQTLSEVTAMANQTLEDGAESVYIKALGRQVTRAEINAAKQARLDLQEFIKREAIEEGRNAIEDITSEAGKALAINFAGASNAMDLANQELDKAKNSTAMAIDRIKIAFKNLTATFIGDLAPTIESISRKFMEFVAAIQEMDPKTRKMIAAVIAAAAAIGPLVFIFGQARLAGGVLLESIMKLVPGLKTLSVTSVASSGKLLHLRNGLTMTGNTIVNTNGRFSTFIATLASGNGPVAKLANSFGNFTGILKSTTTASADVTKAVSGVSKAGTDALKMATPFDPTQVAAAKKGAAAIPAGLSVKGTSIQKEIIQSMAKQGVTSQDLMMSKTVKFNAAMNRFVDVNTNQIISSNSQQVQSYAKVHAARMAAEQQYRNQISATAKQKLLDEAAAQKAAQVRAMKEPFYAKKKISVSDTGEFTRKGRVISQASADRIAGGGFGSVAERAKLQVKQLSNVAQKPVLKVKDMATKPIKNFRQATLSASSAVTTLNARNAAFGRAAPGVFARGRVGALAFSKSIMSTSKAFKILKIMMISSGIGALLIGVAAAAIFVAKNFDKIRTQAKPGLDALKSALEAVKRIGMALITPFLNLFGAIGGGGKKGKSTADGIASAFNTVGKAVEKVATFVEMLVNKFVVPLLSTFLGAILNVAKGIFQFIQGIIKLKDNWREGLKMMVGALGKAAKAIFGLWLNVVVKPIVIAIQQAVKLVLEIFTSMVRGVVNLLRYLASAALNIVKFIVQIFSTLGKTLVNIWRESVKIQIQIIAAIAQGAIDVVDFILTAFSLLPRGIGNAVEAAGNIFADFIDGIADAVRGTPLIGWLADKAGIVGAARSGADAIRNIGKSVGVAGRNVADFMAELIDPLREDVSNLESDAMGLVDSVADGVNGFLDSLPGMLDGVQGAIDGVADSVNGFLSNLPSYVSSFGDFLIDIIGNFNQAGDIAGDGFGSNATDKAGDAVEEGSDEVFPPFVDAGGDAGDAAGKAAGENFLEKVLEIIKDLQQKFVDLVLDSVKGALDEASGQLQDALEKQKEAALAVFDEQLKTIEKLEKAEESLTKEKEYQANRRRLIEERELQRANYVRNRALAIYEGRIDDARVLSLEDQKNQTNFQDNLSKTDEERRKDLIKENMDYLKESIKNAQEETQKMLDDQIKAFQDAAKEITKFPPLTIEEYTEQLGQLNDAAQKIAGENGEILQTMMTKMKDNLKMPNANVGVFATGLDELVQVAQQKYGLTGNPNTDTIVGATIGMLAGIEGQIVGNRHTIVAAFDGIVSDVFNTAATFGNIANDIISPALDAISKIFQDKNPMKVFEQAVKDANETILREMQKTVGHVASLVDGLAQQIDKTLIELAVAQAKLTGQLGNDSSSGSNNGGNNSPGNNHDSGMPSEPAPPATGSTAKQMLARIVQGGLNSGIGSSLDNAKRVFLRESMIAEFQSAYSIVNGKITPNNTVLSGLARKYQSMAYSNDPYTREAGKLAAYIIKNFKTGMVTTPAPSTFSRTGTADSMERANSSSGPGFSANVPAYGSNVPAFNAVPAFGSNVPAFGSNVPAFGSNVPAFGSNVPAFGAYFGGRVRRAFGGVIMPGFSSQGIPAILHGGEYVVNAKAVKNIGYATLEALNNMRYATPGKMSGPAGTVINETQNVNIYVDTFIGQEQWFESMMKEYNVKVVPRNQKKAGLENRTISTYSGINRGM